MGWMPQSEKVHNSVKYSQNFMKPQSAYLHYVPKQYAWYCNPSSSSSPDILLSRMLYYTKCQSRKREVIQPNIYGILSKRNQVIHTLDTICMPKFMIVAHAVLQVFCWQGPVWVKFLSMKRGIIQSNIHWILWTVNQVICIMYWSYTPGIMSSAQAVAQIFCWQGCFTIRNAKVGRKIIQPNIYRILPKVNQVIYTLDTMCMPNYMILPQAVLQIFCWKGPLWVKCLSRKRGIIQSNIHRILRKVNQVIYIMYLNCMTHAIILAQVFL